MARPANQSGKWFNAVQYGVRQRYLLLDYDQIEALALEHKPKMIIAGGSAIPRILDFAADARDCRQGGRLSAGRHGAFRRSGGGGAVSLALPACRMSPPPPRTRPCAARAAA